MTYTLFNSIYAINMMILSESRLHNIIIESINNFLLAESQESKSISAAKKLVMQRLGYDEQKADKFVRMDLRQDLPSLRTPEGGKFILGVTRMFCDGQLRDANMIGNLNTTLKYVASDAHINEYDRNLNGMSAQDLIDRFAKNVEMDLENDRNEVGSMDFNGNSDYDIVRIDSHEQASEYGKYTSWCITHQREMFESYTNGGLNQFYFCLRKGFEQVPEEQGEGCPLDEYGLSMIAVSVKENGALNTCTCRWNHSNGGNDNIMTTEEISKVIGMRFYDVFKPNNTWEERVNNAMQRLANGEDPNSVFDYCGNFKHGFARVKLMGKFNYISQNRQLLTWFPSTSNSIKGKWFDLDYTFKASGWALIRMNDRYNLVNQNGQLLTELPTTSNPIKGKWFDDLFEFVGGFAMIKSNGKYNFLNQNGELLSPNQWFDDAFEFENGFAEVKVNKVWYIIDSKGNINIDNQLCTT